MDRRSPILALTLIAALAAGACDAATTTSAPPASQAAAPSESAAPDASASPSAAPSDDTTGAASAEPTASTDPTASPDPTPAPTPVPWKSFTSSRYKYSVKYPADWVVTRGSAKLADQIDDYSTHFVFLSRDVVSGLASISLTATHDKAYMKSHYHAKPLWDRKVSVNGWTGRLMTFSGTDNGRKLYIQHLILAKGKVGYIVEMFSDAGQTSADAALFKRIYQSFRPRS